MSDSKQVIDKALERTGASKDAWVSWDHHGGAELREDGASSHVTDMQVAFYAGWDYAGGYGLGLGSDGGPKSENEKLDKGDLKGLLAAPDKVLAALPPAEVRALARMALKSLKLKKLKKKIRFVVGAAKDIEEYALGYSLDQDGHPQSDPVPFSEDHLNKLIGNLWDAACAALVPKKVNKKIDQLLGEE